MIIAPRPYLVSCPKCRAFEIFTSEQQYITHRTGLNLKPRCKKCDLEMKFFNGEKISTVDWLKNIRVLSKFFK
jgi:transposase-like protein